MESKELNKCVTPDYEAMYKKAEVDAQYWRDQCRELARENNYLRGVKHTIEAILGRKIGENGT